MPEGTTEIRVTGLGGQGVVLAGYIIGRACAIEGGRQATMMQSFGPEARGAACAAALVVSDDDILYPYVRRTDLLVAMSEDGYAKYREELRPDGLLLFEEDLVHPAPLPGQRALGIPSTRIAEGLGRRLVQNIVMVGFVAGVAGLVPEDAMRRAVETSVPAGTEEINLRAFEAGLEHARGAVESPVTAAVEDVPG